MERKLPKHQTLRVQPRTRPPAAAQLGLCKIEVTLKHLKVRAPLSIVGLLLLIRNSRPADERICLDRGEHLY
eukprot:1151160-Pelagomonas_calceolata.AAC.2